MVDFAFLHGGGQGGWVWQQTIMALSSLPNEEAIRCMALDAPGCGRKRDRDTSNITFQEITAELIADIEGAGMSDVVLIGHSQAGMPIPEMAADRPDLFKKLVFVTCSAPLPGKTTLDQMGNGVHGANEDEVGWPVDPETTSMEERFAAMFTNDMTDQQRSAFLTKIGKDGWPSSSYTYSDWRRDHLADMAVTYVLCEQDQALPPEWQERFADRLHADKVLRVDAGHQVMNTKPGELAQILMAEAYN